jgi:hypothetical protein
MLFVQTGVSEACSRRGSQSQLFPLPRVHGSYSQGHPMTPTEKLADWIANKKPDALTGGASVMLCVTPDQQDLIVTALRAIPVMALPIASEDEIARAINNAPETLKRLGERLADILDADHWNNIEPLLIEVAETSIALPGELHPETRKLVVEFAAAIAEKLRKAETKYGYSDGWKTQEWEAECHRHLQDHLTKGDPRDVAIYAAFMWARGWSTTPSTATLGHDLVPVMKHGHACPIADEHYKWAVVEIERLRTAIAQFANPDNWYEEAGLQQWMGKLDARSFAEITLDGTLVTSGK